MKRLIPIILVMLTMTVACGRAPAPPRRTLNVVAAFFPVAEAAERVGGARVHVTNLTPPRAEPHDLELTSRSLDDVLGADLVLYLSHGFQPALEDAVKRAHGSRLDVLGGLGLNAPQPGEGRADPHVWLDPTRWRDVVTRIGRALAKVDPDHASEYRGNADNYKASIDAVGGEYASGLRSCRDKIIVTSHAAFGYLSERYGLRQEPISGISPEAEPDPKRLAQLADIVKKDGVSTIFTETLVSPKVAETLARETGAKTMVLDPMESRPAGGYVGGMRRNLRILRMALNCV